MIEKLAYLSFAMPIPSIDLWNSYGAFWQQIFIQIKKDRQLFIKSIFQNTHVYMDLRT